MCVAHFLQFAAKHYVLRKEESNKIDALPENAWRQPLRQKVTTAKQAGIQAPTRVQPRRASKNKRLMYTDPASSEEEGDEKSEPQSKRRKINGSDEHAESQERAILSTIKAIMAHLDRDKSTCLFGSKPWACHACFKERWTQKHQTRQRQKQGQRRAIQSSSASHAGGLQPAAQMELDSEGEIVRDWTGISVPSDRVFVLGKDSFAIDACGRPMVLGL
jgi:hypothetical protein